MTSGSSRRGGRGAAAAAVLASMLAAAPARAQTLPSNRYAIDVFQGPVLAPSDVIGIAGAYAGYAEGIAGMVANAAAPAVREAFDPSYVSWDVSPSLSIPFNVFGTRDDFDDSGSAGQSYTDFVYVTVGALLKAGPFGAGLNAEIQHYSLTPTAKGAVSTGVTLGKYHALVAVSFLGDQLVVGGGARVCSLSLAPSDAESNLTMIGGAPEFGFLVRPDWQSFRFGATVRLPVHGGSLLGGDVTRNSAGLQSSGGLVLPEDVVLPWEVETGVAVQVGPRPLNPKWIDPRDEEAQLHASFMKRRHAREAAEAEELSAIGDPVAWEARRQALDEEEARRRAEDDADEEHIRMGLEAERRARYWNWPRPHLLLSVELLVTGPVANGVGIARFLAQSQAMGEMSAIGSSGSSVNFSPRFGVETEPIPGIMHSRAGSYYEPARLTGGVGRQHFTFGADVRLFTTTFFGLFPPTTYKAQAYADFSPRYQSVSVGLGVWH
jgi:hypothetical protein